MFYTQDHKNILHQYFTQTFVKNWLYLIIILNSATFAEVMKIVAIILSLIIFSQSLSVCAPAFGPSQQNEDVRHCGIEKSESAKPVKSCCVKKGGNKQDQKEKKGCCGENCQCFTCSKVFFSEAEYLYNLAYTENTIYVEQTMFPLYVHSYDFHPSISYPPIF